MVRKFQLWIGTSSTFNIYLVGFEMKKLSRVYVEITNICNRNCSFCPGTVREKGRMSIAEFEGICVKLKGVTDYLYLHIMGEPLTHPDLIDMIRLAVGYGYKVAITTNGTLISRVGEELIASGVYKVNISVHSFEEGTTEEYLSYINSVLDFAKAASEKGVLTVLRLWNRGYDEGRNISTVDLMREKFKGEWKQSAGGARIHHRLHLEYGDRFDWPDMAAPDMGGEVFCHGLGDHFGILLDGRVVPCCLDREGAITLGNIHTDNIEEILSGERATKMREGFKNRCATEELCRRCGYARRF